MTHSTELILPTDDFSGFAAEWNQLRANACVPIQGEETGTLLIGGDVCPTHVRSIDASVFGDLLPSFGAADATIINLECPLTNSDAAPSKSGPRLTASPRWASVLSQSRISAVSLANNHAMDAGHAGLRDTLDACAASGLLTIGAGDRVTAAASPGFLKCGPARVAVLGIAEHEFGVATRSTPGVAPLDPNTNMAAIATAKTNADAVVVLLHGGSEHYPLPSPWIREYCHFLVAAGADAVICQHSHTLGAIEIAHGSVISYGTGNLLFPYPGRDSGSWNEGCLLELEISNSGITSVRLLPFVYDQALMRVRRHAPAEERSFDTRLRSLNARVRDHTTLEAEWGSFIHDQRTFYLSSILGLNRPERVLLRSGVWPSWKRHRSTLPALLNLVRCESHASAVTDILTREVDRAR